MLRCEQQGSVAGNPYEARLPCKERGAPSPRQMARRAQRDEALRCVSVWSVRTDAAAIAAANQRRAIGPSSCFLGANILPCAANASPPSGAGSSNRRTLHTEPHRREQRANLPPEQAARGASLVRWSPHLALAALADVESVTAACDGSAPATSAAPPARRPTPPRRWPQSQYRSADRAHQQCTLACSSSQQMMYDLTFFTLSVYIRPTSWSLGVDFRQKPHLVLGGLLHGMNRWALTARTSVTCFWPIHPLCYNPRDAQRAANL